MEKFVGLGSAFPLSEEFRALDVLLCSNWSELPDAILNPQTRQTLGSMIADVLATPFPERLSILLHPAFVDWHFGFCQAAQNALNGTKELPEQALLEQFLEVKKSVVGNQEDIESRGIPMASFRLTTTAPWAVRCLREQMRIDVHIVRPEGEEELRPTANEEDIFVEDLSSASALIANCWPEQWDEITQVIRYVIPFRSHARDSFSPNRAQGSIYISFRPGDPLWLADTVVHEARHNRLNLLQRRLRLYDNNSELRYWSPWRQTDRHLKGILHGVYAFTGVAHFHGLLLESGASLAPLSIRRIMEETDRVFSMLKLLQKHGEWTESGEKVLNDLCAEAAILADIRDSLIRRLCPGYTAKFSRSEIEEALHVR